MVEPQAEDDPDRAPGNPSWTRTFTETNAAQREPLADGVARLSGLRPVYWAGPAHERFLGQQGRLVDGWEAALDIHVAVAERVSGHNNFVHELRHLWSDSHDNPDERRRLRELHDWARDDLGRFLVEMSARLDGVAPEPWRAAEPPVDDQPRVELVRSAPEPEQADQEPSRPEPEPSAPEFEAGVPVSESRDVLSSFQQRWHEQGKLNDQLLVAERAFRISWPDSA